jgi:hypothetical protein
VSDADPAPDPNRVTPLDLLRVVVRTARAEPARVFLPALLIFGLDALNTTSSSWSRRWA